MEREEETSANLQTLGSVRQDKVKQVLLCEFWNVVSVAGLRFLRPHR